MNKWILNTLVCGALFSTSVFAKDIENCELNFTSYPVGYTHCQLSNHSIEALKDYSLTHPTDVSFFLEDVSASKETSEKFISMLVNNPYIKGFILVSSPDFSSALEGLVDKKNLEELSLENDDISVRTFLNLSENQSIKSLGIIDKNIKAKELLKFTENHPLTDLFISEMQFNHIEAQKLSEQNPELKSLSLADVKLDETAFLEKFPKLEVFIIHTDFLNKDILNSIANHPKLNTLMVNSSNMTDTDVEIISKNSRLKNISLTNNKIGDKGAVALSQITNLQALDLYDNKISDNGAIALSEHSELYMLDLGNNQIADAGGIALSNKANFDFLSLFNNKLGDATAYAFANQTTDMLALSIWGNHFSKDARCALINNKHIQSVSVESCDDEYNRKGHHLLKNKTTGEIFMQFIGKGIKKIDKIS